MNQASQTIALNPAGALVLPREIIQRYKTSKFSLTPFDGILVLEPEEDDNSPTYALTQKEEQKLESAIQEESLPIENLVKN